MGQFFAAAGKCLKAKEQSFVAAGLSYGQYTPTTTQMDKEVAGYYEWISGLGSLLEEPGHEDVKMGESP